MFNKLRFIFNLLLGKEIIVYNIWTKEVLMIISSETEILTKRYDYDFISKNNECLKGNDKTGKLYYIKELEEE